MSKITKSARGKSCTFRVSGYGGCSDDPDGVKVFLCHAPCGGKGMSYKSGSDFFAAYGCQNCHDLMDDRRKIVLSDGTQRYLASAEKSEAWLRAIYETQAQLMEAELIEVKA